MRRNRVYISKNAFPELIGYLKDKGCELCFTEHLTNVSPAVSDHTDLIYVRLDEDTVFEGDRGKLSKGYPGEVIYNACSTGKYFIHNLKYTDEALLRASEELGLIPVNVRQGYARCSIIPVDGDSIITYDRGVAEACRKTGIDVLLVRPGYVSLEDYDTGFIGGTAGRIGQEIVFNGDLSKHPDYEMIVAFIREKGLEPVYFTGHPLTDIGSVV